MLDKHFKEGLEEKEAIILGLSILKQVMEEKIKEDIVEVMIGKIGHEFETLT